MKTVSRNKYRGPLPHHSPQGCREKQQWDSLLSGNVSAQLANTEEEEEHCHTSLASLYTCTRKVWSFSIARCIENWILAKMQHFAGLMTSNSLPKLGNGERQEGREIWRGKAPSIMGLWTTSQHMPAWDGVDFYPRWHSAQPLELVPHLFRNKQGAQRPLPWRAKRIFFLH